jgi:protocatechuate 3,4-dioxygenase alpha subunit
VSLRATTWQTVGPFFQIGLAWLYCDNLAGPDVAGERIEISGQVLDGDGKPVPDAVLEIWQANAQGKYAHPDDLQQKSIDEGFTGFGRIPTDEAGRFRFTTIKPGSVPAPPAAAGGAPVGESGSENWGAFEPSQAPHIAVSVLTRGLLRRLVTRIYFPDDPSNAGDFALNLVEPGRRETLIAKTVDGRAGALEWDVVLQGPNETVFFDC